MGFAGENLHFYVDVEHFNLAADEERLLLAEQIVKDYIKEDINISSDVRKGILNQMERVRSLSEHPEKQAAHLRGIFDEAQESIMVDLRQHSFDRFLESMFFDAMVKGIECRKLVVNPRLPLFVHAGC